MEEFCPNFLYRIGSRVDVIFSRKIKKDDETEIRKLFCLYQSILFFFVPPPQSIIDGN